MTRKDRRGAGRPQVPPRPLPGLGDTVCGLPQGTRPLAWDGGTRYLVTDDTTTGGGTTAWVVDAATGGASPRVNIGSVLAQTDPDEWQWVFPVEPEGKR